MSRTTPSDVRVSPWLAASLAALVLVPLACKVERRGVTTSAPAPSGDSEPSHCGRDADCPGYLRCLSGRCADPPALDGVVTPGTPKVVFELPGGREASFFVELAEDEYARVRGLMFRPRLATGWGMLFLFDHDQVHTFWMKNTLVPLDMVFLGADGRVVCVVPDATPLTTSPRTCGRPSRHVLELNAGVAARHGIRAGVGYRVVGLVGRSGP